MNSLPLSHRSENQRGIACTAIGAALVVAGDAMSKSKAERSLALYEPVPLLGDTVQLTLGYNTGVAFGLFAGSTWIAVWAGLIIVGGVVWLVRSASKDRRILATVSLILGGALGNFLDRLVDGRVTDFIDIGIGASRWPTFNLADSSIVIGVITLMVLTFSAPTEADRDRQRPSFF